MGWVRFRSDSGYPDNQFVEKDKEEVAVFFSKRAKHLAVFVLPDGSVRARAPFGADIASVRKILSEQKGWIEKERHLLKEKFGQNDFVRIERRMFPKVAGLLRVQAEKKAEEINRCFYGFRLRAIFIKDMKTRWGSANFKKGEISLNWRAVFLPEDLFAYLLSHELCHLKHPNHSTDFWREVSLAVPDFERKRKMLRGRNMDFVPKGDFDRITALLEDRLD